MSRGSLITRSFPEAEAFLASAEGWLMRSEARHNLVLGIARARPTGALFATVEEDGDVIGCVVRTPPHKVLLTEMPTRAAGPITTLLAENYDRIPALLGPAPISEAVAAEWVARRGGSWRPGMEQRLYRLDEVTPPRSVPGHLREAERADLDLAMTWGEGFARDAHVSFADRPAVERWIEDRMLHIWDTNGIPVSIAVAQGRTPNGIRIGYVYTPPRHRGQGFASACVAALSQKMLDRGLRFCLLYADLANPASNAIYRRVGYRPLQDVRDTEIVACVAP